MSDELGAGLYETIVNEAFAQRLSGVDDELVDRRALRTADASDRIAQYLARELKRGLDSVPDADRVAVGVGVARRLLDELFGALPQTAADAADVLPTDQVLHAIGVRRVDGSVRMPTHPLIPLLDTTLLTNAPGEPRVGSQVLTEIDSADAIDVVMAFVRRSGLLPFAAALREHCARGRRLRVLTTTYTGSTEAKALGHAGRPRAPRCGCPMTSRPPGCTRRRGCSVVDSAFSTAYVGSSNLTHSAQVAGRGVERPRLRCPQPGRHRQGSRRLRELLAGRGLHPLRRRRVSA